MYKLIIQDDEGKTTVVPLIREELTIGRQEGNTIRLTERNVSRRHAKLHRGQEAIIIEDLDSYNGVRVNGSRIHGRQEIKEADRVQIGDYLIEVKAEQAGSENATEKISASMLSQTSRNTPIPVPVEGSDAKTVPNPVGSNPDAPSPANGDTAAGSGNFSKQAATASAAVDDDDGHGRLVVLSTSMAGREFELDKVAMVIGRTEENDLWVNHRSISRHHAKVIRENGSYAIVDLQSANGVRVNGEDYGKVELRGGDLIDLGHVRFRYVAPGEDFVFARDASVVDISTEGKSGKGLWFAVAVLVAAVAAFLLMTNGDDKKQAATTDPPVVTDARSESLATVSDAGTAMPDARAGDPPIDADLLKSHIDSALAARKGDDWDAMKIEAAKALALDPANAQALELAEQAEFESTNQALFESFQQVVAKRQWSKIASMFALIDDASVYKIKGRADHDRLKGEYSRYQLQVAQKAAKRGKCAELSKLAEQTPPEWPGIASAITEIKCKAPDTSTNTTSNGGGNNTNNGGNATNNGGTKDPVDNDSDLAASDSSYDELMDQATAAIKDTQFGKGLKLCRQALQKQPNDQRATMTCVIASCNLKDATSAKKFVRKIKSAGRRSGLRQICLKHDIELND